MDVISFDGIVQNVGRYVDLSAKEIEAFKTILVPRQLKKREYLLTPGQICEAQSYVVSGALRNFYVSPDGAEHTLQFAVEDWFISDFGSYVQRQPATLYIEALEDSALLQLNYDDVEQLCADHPKFERFFRLVAQKAFAFSQLRVLDNLGLSARERYESFNGLYPQIVQRVPQYTLASYLGMTPEFLSKIRKQIAQEG